MRKARCSACCLLRGEVKSVVGGRGADSPARLGWADVVVPVLFLEITWDFNTLVLVHKYLDIALHTFYHMRNTRGLSVG